MLESPNAMLTQLNFPPRTLFTNAAYIPVFIEPVVGSGERLCIAVILKFGDRQELVMLPAMKRLLRLYGSAAKSLQFAVSIARHSLDETLHANGIASLAGWRSPVEGIVLGESRITSAKNFEDCVRIAFSQCASLFEVPTIAEEDAAKVVGRRFARLTISRLEKTVAEDVIAQRPSLHKAFSQRFQVSPNARATRVGFVGPHLVANFGILVPTNLQSLVDAAKARLLDLERLREGKLEALFPQASDARFELFMKRATLKNVEYSEGQIKAVDEAAEEITYLAKKADIVCQAFETPEGIVGAILEAEPA